jgi:hypothetical protein
MTKDNQKATLADHNVKVGDVVQWNGGLMYTVQDDKFLMSNDNWGTTYYKSWWDISTQFTVVSRASTPAHSFVVGDKVVLDYKYSPYGITLGKAYTVTDVDNGMLYITNDSGGQSCFNQEHFKAEPKIMESNIIISGGTYTTHNGGKWHCIYTTDEHAYMITQEGSTAYVWTLDGSTLSLGSHDRYDVNWGPITKGGVSIDRGVLTIGGLDWFVEGVITTVDGVPDWSTISVKAREV